MGVNIEGSLIHLNQDSGKTAAEKLFKVVLETHDESPNSSSIHSQEYDDVIAVFEYNNKALIIPNRERSIMYDMETFANLNGQQLKDYSRLAKTKACCFSFSDTAAAYTFLWFEDWVRTDWCGVKITEEGYRVLGNDLLDIKNKTDQDLAMVIYPNWLEQEFGIGVEVLEEKHVKVYKVVRALNPMELIDNNHLLKIIGENFRSANSFFLMNSTKTVPLLSQRLKSNKYFIESKKRGIDLKAFKMDSTELASWSDKQLMAKLAPIKEGELPSNPKDKLELFILQSECKFRYINYKPPFQFYSDQEYSFLPETRKTFWENKHHTEKRPTDKKPEFYGGDPFLESNYENEKLPERLQNFLRSREFNKKAIESRAKRKDVEHTSNTIKLASLKQKANTHSTEVKSSHSSAQKLTSSASGYKSTSEKVEQIDLFLRWVWGIGIVGALIALLAYL